MTNPLLASSNNQKNGEKSKINSVIIKGTGPRGQHSFETFLIDKNTNQKEVTNIVKKVSSELSKTESPQIITVVADETEIRDRVEKISTNVKNQLNKSKLTEVKTLIDDAFKEKYKKASDLFKKHERISLTITRFLVNGTTVSAGLLINGGLSPITAMSIGMLSGGISGLFQFYNAKFQTLIDGNPDKNKITIETKKHGEMRVKTMQMSKWFLTEVSIYALIKTFSYTLGVPVESFNAEAIKVLKASALATASQGLWDSTIATETKVSLRNAEGNTAEQERIQRISNTKTFAVSMVSVFGGILSLMGVQIGTWTLGVLGVTGAFYTYKAWKNGKLSINSDRPVRMTVSQFSALNCKKLFY